MALMQKLSFYANFHIHSTIKMKQSLITLHHGMEYFSEMPYTFPTDLTHHFFLSCSGSNDAPSPVQSLLAILPSYSQSLLLKPTVFIHLQ